MIALYSERIVKATASSVNNRVAYAILRSSEPRKKKSLCIADLVAISGFFHRNRSYQTPPRPPRKAFFPPQYLII